MSETYVAPAITDIGSLQELTQYGPPGPGGSTTKIPSVSADYHYPAGYSFNFS